MIEKNEDNSIDEIRNSDGSLKELTQSLSEGSEIENSDEENNKENNIEELWKASKSNLKPEGTVYQEGLLLMINSLHMAGLEITIRKWRTNNGLTVINLQIFFRK